MPEGGWLQKAGFHVDKLWRRLDGQKPEQRLVGRGGGRLRGIFQGNGSVSLSQ